MTKTGPKIAYTTHTDDSLETAMEERPVSIEEGLEPVAAPYVRFSAGLQAVRGYRLDEDGDSLSLAFEPWFVESDNPLPSPACESRSTGWAIESSWTASSSRMRTRRGP